MLLQAALNGPFTQADHSALPLSVEELIADSVACVAAGAGAVHLHPRDEAGNEQLRPDVVDGVANAVREACGVPVGVSTGAWIEPDLRRRLALIRGWRAPDYASVNVSEEGSFEVMRVLLEGGIGVEAGVWSVEDAERLAASGMADTVTRILIEPVDVGAAAAVAVVERIHATLDRLLRSAPRLQHGDGEATWVLLSDAVARGIDTRIGLEDTRLEPDGRRTTGNAALVSRASQLGAGVPR